MSVGESVVIVGAGQAGGELAAALRSSGYGGEITLVGAEPTHPYSRPPLSKAYLLGTVGSDELMLRAPHVYERHEIDLRLGATATGIDLKRKAVMLDDGARLDYSTLVLATGGRARRLPIPELKAATNVFYIRTLEDVDRLRARLAPGARMIIIGAGYVGLEVGAVARRSGLDVTVIEAESRVLARVASPPISEFFHRIHAEEGVDIRLGTTIAGCVTDGVGDVRAVRLSDGSSIESDIVLVGVGLVPNTELAEAAGLAVDDGILVDEFLRTSDPDVCAIGDVSRYPDAESGGRRRLESVPNALEQAGVVARAVAGRARPYTSVPRFWSDQYDVKVQMVGLADEWDEIVIRDDITAGRRFAAFCIKDGVVVAATVANSPRDYAMARKLVADRTAVDVVQLAESSVSARVPALARPAANL